MASNELDKAILWMEIDNLQSRPITEPKFPDGYSLYTWQVSDCARAQQTTKYMKTIILSYMSYMDCIRCMFQDGCEDMWLDIGKI